MISYVKAGAPSNIALVKYWGKRDISENIPAVPSISLAIDKLYTETEVVRIEKGSDEFHFEGQKLTDSRARRVFEYLDLWRSRKHISGNFSVTSKNCFPSASGMASSASGFAALATALSGFAEKEMSTPEISRLARRGSGSAARSVTGGLSVFQVDNDDPYAEQLYSPDKIPFGMVAVLVERKEKKTGSKEGMIHSAETSPYFAAWIDRCRHDYDLMIPALKNNDFSAIGRIAEENCLAMHACMLSSRPRLLYWTETTLRVIQKIVEFREDGLETYFTIDAGPQIFLLGNLDDLETIEKRAGGIEGVEETIVLKPSDGARIIECS